MKSRNRVNRRRDRKFFRKTAALTNTKNVPGHLLMRGGIRL